MKFLTIPLFLTAMYPLFIALKAIGFMKILAMIPSIIACFILFKVAKYGL